MVTDGSFIMRMGLKACCCVLALLAAVFLGYGYGLRKQMPLTAEVDAATVINDDPLENFREERSRLRQLQISQLNEIIHGQESEYEISALAQKRLMELMDWSEKEMTIEGILSLRGFEDALVTVHEETVNVLLRSEDLNPQQSAIILELILRETGFSAGNVKIMPIN